MTRLLKRNCLDAPVGAVCDLRGFLPQTPFVKFSVVGSILLHPTVCAHAHTSTPSRAYVPWHGIKLRLKACRVCRLHENVTRCRLLTGEGIELQSHSPRFHHVWTHAQRCHCPWCFITIVSSFGCNAHMVHFVVTPASRCSCARRSASSLFQPVFHAYADTAEATTPCTCVP